MFAWDEEKIDCLKSLKPVSAIVPFLFHFPSYFEDIRNDDKQVVFELSEFKLWSSTASKTFNKCKIIMTNNM